LRAPEGINIEALRALANGETVSECEDMLIRSMAAARTFKRRVEAQIIPLGEVADDFNFNTEKKRVLNQVFEPSFDDNVKQDKSIDVYGRADEDFNDEVSKLANA
jgi:phosphatidylinositol glycan class S